MFFITITHYFLILSVILFVFVNRITFADDNECPTEDDPTMQARHLPGPSCNKFYICSQGTKIEQICPPGLVFNPETQNCDWPQNVQCSRQGNEDSAPKECPKDNATGRRLIHIAHEECTKFYKCDHGEKIEQECENGGHFDPDFQVCGPPKSNPQGCTP